VTIHWFPDNTVLCNFASIGQIDLLEQILNGRGRWVEAIAQEVRRSSVYLPDLAKVEAGGWLGEPIEIDEISEIDTIERVRRSVFGGLEGQPTKHLGEAQTCHVVRSWPQFSGSFWVTDDGEALRYARYQGLHARETVDLISEGVAFGVVSRQIGFGHLKAMLTAGRHLRVPINASHL